MAPKSSELEYFVVKGRKATFSPDIILEFAKNKSGQKYIRRQGSNVIYREAEEGYECTNCRTAIVLGYVPNQTEDVSASQKEADRQYVPFCQKCEGKITIKGKTLVATQIRLDNSLIIF
jgi:DNA-directed RNA polymerase subunit RPC12/RpoP